MPPERGSMVLIFLSLLAVARREPLKFQATDLMKRKMGEYQNGFYTNRELKGNLLG